MRVTDLSVKQNFLVNYSDTKRRLNEVQNQLATQKRINKPSDSPGEIGTILRLSEELGEVSSYRRNADTSLSQMEQTIGALDNILYQSDKTTMDLFEMRNSDPPDVLFEVLPDSLEVTLNTLIEYANTEFDGKYIFGGTDYSSPVYSYNSATNSYELNSSTPDGKQQIQVGRNTNLDININGAELFSSVIKQTGTFSTSEAVGFTLSDTKEIFDASGNEYEFEMNYTKTAANTYDLSYQLTDSTGAVVHSDSKEMIFNSTNGRLDTMGGSDPDYIRVNIPAQDIDFYFDPQKITESSDSTVMAFNQNQKADIFNVLLNVKERIETGQRPTDNQLMMIEDYSQVVRDKLTEAGDKFNKIEDTQNVLDSEEQYLMELRSKKTDLDMAKAIIDMQSKQYNLDVLYKVSSMTLPRSILDYL